MNRKLSPAWTLAILTGLNLFNYLDRYVLSAVLAPLQKDLHINDGDAGRIMTAFMIGYFVTSPFFGYLGDRFPRKWLIAGGIFVWSIGTVLTGFAATFGVLLGYRVLVGLGEASYATISPSLISDNYETKRRNNALTIFYVAIPVGAALGSIIGAQIAEHYTWRDAFIWAGAPGLVLALVLLPFKEPERGGKDGTKTSETPTVKDILNLVRIPDYMLVVAGYCAYTFALGAFGLWGPTFLVRVHNVPVANAGSFFGAVLVISGLVGTLIGGFAATRWQKRDPAGYAWTLALSVLAAVPFVVAAFMLKETWASMASLAVAMFLLFLCTGPVNTLIIETVPVNLRSSAMALSIFAIHLFGDMWSSEIVGRLADHWNNLRTALMILPGALLIGGVLWLALVFKTKMGLNRGGAEARREN
ncbi:MAG TPA: MFS transporter [Verrucomicrobiae bacterium]|nr:MFS transporter [Verrucomicrobiae bacterium]